MDRTPASLWTERIGQKAYRRSEEDIVEASVRIDILMLSPLDFARLAGRNVKYKVYLHLHKYLRSINYRLASEFSSSFHRLKSSFHSPRHHNHVLPTSSSAHRMAR